MTKEGVNTVSTSSHGWFHEALNMTILRVVGVHLKLLQPARHPVRIYTQVNTLKAPSVLSRPTT